MKKTKILLTLPLGICLLLVLAAYLFTYKFSGYTYDSGMEYHVFPEEYDEEYSEYIETISLKKNTDYRVEVEAICQAGTMDLTILYADGSEKQYSVDAGAPFNEVIEVSKNTTDEIKIAINFNPDTEGTLKIDVYAHRHYFLI